MTGSMPRRPIPLTRPFVNGEMKEKVSRVLESGFLTEGEVTREFEERVKDFLGVSHVMAVTSCTTGLEAALRALSIGPGHEVIVPDYTHPATAQAVAMVGAKAVLVDVSRETMLMDYDAAARAVTDRTRAIVPVSLFGNPLDYDCLDGLRAQSGLCIIEDAACALGAGYRGVRVGSRADITVFSLHPRKFITTGEGGLVVTGSEEWARFVRSYSHFGVGEGNPGMRPRFEIMGTNCKMSNLLAAIGLVQMERVEELLSRRIALAENYRRLLSPERKVNLPATTDGGAHSWQTFCIYVDNRDRVIHELASAGIETQIGTYALHREPAFSESERCHVEGAMTGSDFAFDHALALPLYHDLSGEEQVYVVETLRRVVA